MEHPDDRSHDGADGSEAGELDPEITGRLRDLERSVQPEEICELWIFPPLSEIDGSAEFFLFTRFAEDDRRGLCSARLRRRPDGEVVGDGPDRPEVNGSARNGEDGASDQVRAVRQKITEHGSVPADRLPRLVERFRKRLGEDEEPLHFRIEGSPSRWKRLVRVDGEPASL